MKKRVTAGRPKAPAEVKPDLAGLIGQIQQHLVAMDRKLDTLISRSSERPLEPRYFSNPYQRIGAEQPNRPSALPIRPPAPPNRPPEQRQNNNPPRERIMHKAVCADCSVDCEVPFRPSDGRPVYCKECYGKRRHRGQAKDAGAPKVEEAVSVQKRHVEKAPPVEVRKGPAKKKRPRKRR